MKEASGELNMTVVTIIAITAIATFFGWILWPRIQKSINDQWDVTNNNSYINAP